MAYAPFNQALPDGTANGAATLEDIRENQAALRDMILLGFSPGWNFAMSGGTADQPDQVLLSKSTERLRAVLTWGTTGGASGNVTQVVASYSANSGTTYDSIGTFTLSYDSDANVVSGNWS